MELLYQFVEPYYKNKDIMHDLSHIMRVERTAERLMQILEVSFDARIVKYAIYFHGFIYSHEEVIREWLTNHIKEDALIERIIQAAWDSQKSSMPITAEGMLVHDAHMIEGGKTYLIVKSLITGSLRGQDLETTIRYIESNVLDKGICYYEQAQSLYEVQQDFAKAFIVDLKDEVL